MAISAASIATLPPSCTVAFNNATLVWTKREFLEFKDFAQESYSLPIFIEDAKGPVLFTDENGHILKFCEDPLFEGFDRHLLWLRQHLLQWGEEDVDGQWNSSDWRSNIYVYSSLSDASDSTLPLEAQSSHPSEVFIIADYFDGDQESQHAGWERLIRMGEDADLAPTYVWTGPFSNDDSPDNDIALPGFKGQALHLDPGIGRMSLHRQLERYLHGTQGQLHTRAYFYDELSRFPSAHWMGVSSQYGSVALGIGPDVNDYYSYVNGSCPIGQYGDSSVWQVTAMPRTRGWHLFEIIIENSAMMVYIDGECASRSSSTQWTPDGVDEKLWLVACRGCVGHWAAVEMIYTPLGGPWQKIVQSGEHESWRRITEESGRWQIVASGGLGMVLPLAPLENNSPEPAEVSPPEPPRPPTSGQGLTIECWSIPGEGDMARIERVMAAFVQQLQAAGIIVPDNLQRVGRCGALQDPQPCYIYRFGTRRIHVNIRDIEGGRLCLVVRCGGGFLDFAEFARKNGSAEQLKMLRMQRNAKGVGIVQVSSVLSNRRHQVREMR